MDRKGLIGIVLALAGFIWWQAYYTGATNRYREAQRALQVQREAEAAAAAPAVETGATQPPQVASSEAAPTAAAPPVIPPPPAIEAAKPELTELATPAAGYTFTNLGGGIHRTELRHHEAENGSRVVMNEFGAIPIGAIAEIAGEGTGEPFTSTVNAESREVVFERTDARQLVTTKKFTLPRFEGLTGKEKLREEYLLRMDVTFTNRGAQAIQAPAYYVHTGSAAPVHQHDQPIYTGFNWLHGTSNEFVDVNWFSGGGILFFSKPPRPIYTETRENIRWAGVTNQYFTSLISPSIDETAVAEVQAKQFASSVWARRFNVPSATWATAGHASEAGAPERMAVDGALGMPGFTLAPGETVSRSFTLYVGPREYRRLRELGNYQAEIMDFGIFGMVSKLLLNSMNWLHGWLKSYALAIIVLTLIIKTLLWPLQNKATNSMKRMQALQPKMVELREKYKDDPAKMNQEVMRLYKDYGVNPVGGCLPLLVQIPIFFGFYMMLGKAVELRNSGFLWVEDLSQPDTVAVLLGIPVNVLPILMAATMFWQMAIQPKSGDPIQQRVFMFMPLIFIFFCYNFASALALYWTVQNLFSIVQLYATRNQAPPVLQKVTPPAVKKKSRK